MSAGIESKPFEEFFKGFGIKVLSIKGRQYPVDVKYVVGSPDKYFFKQAVDQHIFLQLFKYYEALISTAYACFSV